MKHVHAEQMAQYAQDAMETDKPWLRWEYRFGEKGSGDWSEWRRCAEYNLWMTDSYRAFQYRRKSTKKPVDLSVLIDSGIDCEFMNEHGTKVSIGKLVAFQDKPKQYMGDTGSMMPLNAEHCRPRLNHIHAWQGGECPLPEGFMVKIYYCEGKYPEKLDEHKCRWDHSYKGGDIIAFEVIGLADGYCYPWQTEECDNG